MAGVTPEGFEAKRLADVLADAEQDLAAIVDPDTGDRLQPDFGSQDPAMQVVKVPLEGLGGAWEAIQMAFTQFDPGSASKTALSKLVQINGLNRLDASGSLAPLEYRAAPGTPIPAGSMVSDTSNRYQWATLSDVVVGVSGVAEVTARCTTFGPIAAKAGTLTNSVTQIPGVTSVTNTADAILGRDRETDEELRARRDRSTMAPAASPVESVYANISNLPGVTFARARQNRTLEVDANGIPPKSVAVVVVGGAPLDIAYTLLERTGITAEWFGNTGMTLYDEQGEPYEVRWTVPTAVPIFVRIELQVLNHNLFPVDGAQQIKDALKKYAQGGAPALGIDDGFSTTGFPPGSSVILSRLYTPINSVPGHRVESLTIGLSPESLASADVPVTWDQYAEFLDSNIDIVVL